MARRVLLWFAAIVASFAQTKPIDVTAGWQEGSRFAQFPNGIWIAGPPPVTIALAASQLRPLPRPALYTRYGRAEVTAAFCGNVPRPADCEDWLHRSERRRVLLRQLVSRRFELRGEKYVETRSPTAAKALKIRAELAPSVVPEILRSGVLVPWEALPPRSELAMESIEMHSPPEPSAITNFVIHLERPRLFRFSPCHFPLTVAIERLNQPIPELQPGFFLPRQADLLDTIYVWQDPHDYGWDIPGLILYPQQGRFTQLGEDEWLCGPRLKYRNGAAETALGQAADVAGFEVVRLPDGGGFLAASRPRTHPYGGNGVGGPCAGETSVSWAIFYFKSLPLRAGTFSDHIRTAVQRSHLRLRCSLNEPSDYEVEIAPGLQTITEFEAYDKLLDGKLDWRTRTLTWKDGKYLEGAWKPSAAPASSVIRRKQARW